MQEKDVSMMSFPCTGARRAKAEDAVIIAEENVNVISLNKESKRLADKINVELRRGGRRAGPKLPPPTWRESGHHRKWTDQEIEA